jgi:SpoIID/LytB domain protein
LDILAESFLADGQYAAAERILSLLPESQDKAGFYYINLARAQLGLNERNLAKYNLKKAASAGTHTGLADYLLGTVYAEEADYPTAATYFEKAIAYDHQFTEARRAYAQALEKSGNLREAYRQYKTIYASEKNDDTTNQAIARLKGKIPPSQEKKETLPLITHTIVAALPAQENSQQEVKIGLGVRPNGRPSVRDSVVFTSSHPFSVVNEKNVKIAGGNPGEVWKVVLSQRKPFLLTPAGKKIAFRSSVLIKPVSNDNTKEPTLIVKNIVSGAGMTWMSVADKEYRGKLQVLYNSRLNTLVPVNILSLDAYLQGVIASEMPTQFPAEALRAQAVLARTYALKHIGKHKHYGFDLCDTQNCQVYGGVQAESESGNEAVTATLGEILRYENQPIESVFSANCGGITQSAKDAGWSETPYLKPVSDYKAFDFEQLQPYHFRMLLQYPLDAYSRYDKNVSLAAFRWTRVVSSEDLRKIIKRKKKDIGEIVSLIPERRSGSGYVSQLVVKGTKGQVTLSKENIIRNNLSLGMLRSSYFIIEPNYEKRKLKYFVFYGGGWGHGVGFDQTGAAGRADSGQDYKEILHHYFPLAEFYSLPKK